MRNTFIWLLISASLFASCAEEKQETATSEAGQAATVFYLIRHAEKDRTDPENRNPELTAEGHARAAYWKDVFREVPLTAVYSTDYNRTRQTASPTAASKGLDVKLYSPDTTDLKHWVKMHRGGHILIVGHSNTTPALANQLSAVGHYPDIDDNNNGNLYIVNSAGPEYGSVLYLEPSHMPHMETP